MPRKKNPSSPPRVPIAFRLHAKLATAASMKARRAGLSRSAYVEQLIRKDLNKESVDLEARTSDFTGGSVFE